MAKFPEAEARKFKRKFVCKSCKRSLMTSNMLVLQEKVKCRKCHSTSLRPARKK
ncbi:MAG: 50S ribosomal protein L40e [Candidatus Woesearchaeota archaeon]